MKHKKDLLPKSHQVAEISYSTEEKCMSCQYLQINWGTDSIKMGFSNTNPDNILKFTSNLIEELAKFNIGMESVQAESYRRAINSMEERLESGHFDMSKEYKNSLKKQIRLYKRKLDAIEAED